MKYLASLIASFICFSILAQPSSTFIEAYVENNQGMEIPVELQLFSGNQTLFVDLVTNSNGYGNVMVESDLPWDLGIGIIFDCNDSMQIAPLIESDIPEVGYQVYFDYCQSTQIFGCTDSTAINYNPFATIDDGSCEYSDDCEGTEAVLIINNYGAEGFWSITNLDGVLLEFGDLNNDEEVAVHFTCLDDGCYNLNFSDVFSNNDQQGFFTLWVGDLLGANDYLMPGESSYSFIVGEGCDEWISGCTDPNAINYNTDAVFDDGSCEYPPTENDLCANAIFIEPGEYIIDNTNAMENEGIWGECWNFGSGEGEQSSVWYSFSTPEEPVSIHIEAYSDGTNTLTDTQFGLFLECGGEMIYCDGNSGQGLLSAFSFGCGELEPSTDYILMIDGWNGDAGTAILGFEMSTECDSVLYGCTDPTAINYNPEATVDDGSCIYEECDANTVNLVIETQNWGSEISWNIVQDGIEIYGDGGYLSYSTYTYELCLEDGCYNFEMFDSFGDGWNQGSFTMFMDDQIISSGTLESGEYGSLAFGINEDGCEGTIIWGCTDPAATNYNPLATNDDGSCYYIDSCEVWVESYYITCSSYEFFAFSPWGETQPNGTWTVNGEVVQDFGNTLYFEFTEPGTHEICYNVWTDECGAFTQGCSYVYVGPECFEDCYDLEYTMVDSCTYVFSLTNLPDSVESVLWITAMGDAFEAGPTITLDLDTMGVYWICAYIPGSLCPEVCTQIWAEGCGDQIIWGCTDPQAVNYNPLATHDDGSCFYTDSCQVFIEPFYYNCSTYEFFAFTPWGDIATGGIWAINGESFDTQEGVLYYEFPEPGFYNICYSDVWLDGCNSNTEGCFDLYIDPECFEPCPELELAMVDSCTYEFTMTNLPDGVNTVQWILENGDVFEAGPTLTLTYDNPGVYWICGYIPDSDCPEICTEFWVEGCGDELVWGCTDPQALNYNPLATIDDGSCIYESECEGIEGALIIDSNYEFSGWWEIMDTETGNYIDGDTIQSGIQFFDICLEDGCYNMYLNLVGNQIAEAWVTIVAGNQDVFFAVLPTGEYSFDFQVGEGCGEQDILGCTDPVAINYNPEATIDDGSCIYEFDCSVGFAILPDTTGENVIWIIPTFDINNAVEILWDFGDGTTSTEFFPQHEYAGDGPYTLCLYALLVEDNGNTCEANFCADITGALIGSGLTSSGFSINVIPGEVLSVENTSLEFELNLFPNPAQESINISFRSDYTGLETFVLYDLTGKVIDEIQIPVAVGENVENIDIKHLPNGLYVLSLRNISNQRFVKSD